MRRMLLTLATICLAVISAAAANLDGTTIIKRMKQAIEGPSDTVRLMTLSIKQHGDTLVEWKIAHVTGTADGAPWMLTVVLEPLPARGMAFLSREELSATSGVKYTYLPATKRVLEFKPVEGYEAFFGTDFSYQDLGFMRLGGRGEKLVGTQTYEDKKVYKLEDYPVNHPIYSKVVSYVATDSFMPVERDFYYLSGSLFKTEHYTVEMIDGTPTIRKIVANNVNSGGSSEIDVTKVIHIKPAPAELFDPRHLPEIADNPFWKTVAQ